MRSIHLVLSSISDQRIQCLRSRKSHKNTEIPIARKLVLAISVTMFTFSTLFLILSIMRFVISTNIVNMQPLKEGQTHADRIAQNIFSGEVIFYTMSSIFSIQVRVQYTYSYIWEYANTSIWTNRSCWEIWWYYGGLMLSTKTRNFGCLCHAPFGQLP